MRRVLVSLAVLVIATEVALAQQTQPANQSNIVMKQRVMQSQDGPPTPPSGDILFMASEVNFGGKVVKGAPYSAQAVTETIQTLNDGNRIVNKTTSSLYRDSEGRTRREMTIKMLGSLVESGEPLQTIFINDPVAGVSYSLDSKTHLAHKSIPFKITRSFRTGVTLPPMSEGQRFEYKIEEGPSSGVVVKTPPPGVALPPGAAAPESVFRIQTETGGGATYIFRRKGPNENEVKEQLGKQFIEGVEAEGTRTTITIPAGEIGNERPIEIVSEQWYSPELQMDIMTRHSDPRSGETTYRLTNINRSEPAKTLFEVPSDYTIKEGLKVAPNIGPLPARVRKPE